MRKAGSAPSSTHPPESGGERVLAELLGQAGMQEEMRDWAASILLHERALRLCGEGPEAAERARILISLARAYEAIGDTEEAGDCIRRALPLVGRSGEARELQVELERTKGRIALREGSPEAAAGAFVCALEFAKEGADESAAAGAWIDLARARMVGREWVAARQCLDEAGRLGGEGGFPDGGFQLFLAGGELALREGNPGEACAQYSTAVATARKRGDSGGLIEALQALAGAERERGCEAAAFAALTEAAAESTRFEAARNRHQLRFLRLRLESIAEQHSREIADLEREQLQQHNAALEKANRCLEQVVAERRRLLSVVAHDLRGPLSSVITTAEYARSDPRLRAEDLLHLLEGLGETAEHALSLLDRLLLMGRLEDGGTAPAVETVEVDRFLRRLISSQSTAAQRKQIEVHASIRPPALKLAADLDLVRQVLENLLSNAIKYSPIGSTVRMDARSGEAGRIEIAISDEGPGIPETERSKLFSPFHRAGNQPTGGESSTGLGLYLVKCYAAILGAEVSYQPHVPGGSTFRLVIPAEASERGRAARK